MSYDPSDHAVGACRAAGAWLVSFMLMAALFGPSLLEAGAARAARVAGVEASAVVQRLPGPWRNLWDRRASVRAPQDRPNAVDVCLDRSEE